jgi:hypothetical protein
MTAMEIILYSTLALIGIATAWLTFMYLLIRAFIAVMCWLFGWNKF